MIWASATRIPGIASTLVSRRETDADLRLILFEILVEEARMDMENRGRLGQSFLAEARVAIDALSEADGLDLGTAMSLARAYARAEMEAPESLVSFLLGDVEAQAGMEGVLADLDAQLDDLRGEVGDDDYMLHACPFLGPGGRPVRRGRGTRPRRCCAVHAPSARDPSAGHRERILAQAAEADPDVLAEGDPEADPALAVVLRRHAHEARRQPLGPGLRNRAGHRRRRRVGELPPVLPLGADRTGDPARAPGWQRDRHRFVQIRLDRDLEQVAPVVHPPSARDPVTVNASSRKLR